MKQYFLVFGAIVLWGLVILNWADENGGLVGRGPGDADNPKDNIDDCDCGPSDTSGDYSEFDVDTPGPDQIKWIKYYESWLNKRWEGKWDNRFPLEIKFHEVAENKYLAKLRWSEDLKGKYVHEATIPARFEDNVLTLGSVRGVMSYDVAVLEDEGGQGDIKESLRRIQPQLSLVGLFEKSRVATLRPSSDVDSKLK